MSRQEKMSAKGGKKKQTTIFNTKSFTRVAQHRGKTIDLTKDEPKFVAAGDDPTLLVKCGECTSKFKTTQGLASHRAWAHKFPTLLEDSGSSVKSIPNILSSKKKPSVDEINARDIKYVLNQLLCDVERAEAKEKKNPGRRRGADDRKSYDNLFKLSVLEQVDEALRNGGFMVDVAFQNNVSKSLVSVWNKNREPIYQGAAAKHRKLLKKNRRSGKHDAVWRILIEMFRKTRAKGGKVSYSWIYTKANMINKEINPGKFDCFLVSLFFFVFLLLFFFASLFSYVLVHF